MTVKNAVPPFPTAMTQAVADVLAQTDYPGLTNRELEQLLPAAKLTDWENPAANKRDKLATTLNSAQMRRKSGAGPLTEVEPHYFQTRPASLRTSPISFHPANSSLRTVPRPPLGSVGRRDRAPWTRFVVRL